MKRSDCDVSVRNVVNNKGTNDVVDIIKTKQEKPHFAKNNCPDFSIYQNGTLWEDIRLPSYIRATKYDLEISVPSFNSEIYAGTQTMTIELDKDTKYILFHSASVQIVDGQLYDNTNKVIDIDCGGYYPGTDNYVIVLKNIATKSISPLKLNIKFEGLLLHSEQGMFDISYTGGQSR